MMEIETMADYIKKKVKQDNGCHEPDEHELKDFIESIGEEIDRKAEQDQQSDDENTSFKDEYKGPITLPESKQGDEDIEDIEGDWVNAEDDDDDDDEEDENTTLVLEDDYTTVYDI